MKIEEIINKRVKVSSHSITVKDDRDKTCGVVRDVKPYRELRPAEQMDYFKKLKERGIWGDSEFMQYFIICDGKPYYLHNLRPVETYEKMFKGVEGWESEERIYNARIQAAEKMATMATVIPCYVM